MTGDPLHRARLRALGWAAALIAIALAALVTEAKARVVIDDPAWTQGPAWSLSARDSRDVCRRLQIRSAQRAEDRAVMRLQLLRGESLGPYFTPFAPYPVWGRWRGFGPGVSSFGAFGRCDWP